MIQFTHGAALPGTAWSEPVTQRFFAPLWRVFRHPSLGGLGGLQLLLAWMSAMWLPQLPGQLVSEPVTAARWLQDTRSAFGALGGIAAWLGLFDVARSPVLYVGLTLLAVSMSAHLAEAIARVRCYAQLARGDSSAAEGRTPPPSYRQRLQSPWRVDVTSVVSRVVGLWGDWQVVAPTDDEDRNGSGMAGSLAAMRHAGSARFAVLMPIGVLLMVAAVWWGFGRGERLSIPPLAPGDVYRSAAHGVEVAVVPTADAAEVRVSVDGTSTVVDFPTQGSIRTSLNGKSVLVSPNGVAGWVRSDLEDSLLQPGRLDAVAELGLVLADLGAETSVLMPRESAGLRLLASPGATGVELLVELYRSDQVEPIARAALPIGESVTLAVAGEMTVTVAALPGVQVVVSRSPGGWLGVLGLLVAAAGAVSSVRRPRFVALEWTKWPPDSSASTGSETILLTVISDDRALVEATIQQVGDTLRSEPATVQETRAS